MWQQNSPSVLYFQLQEKLQWIEYLVSTGPGQACSCWFDQNFKLEMTLFDEMVKLKCHVLCSHSPPIVSPMSWKCGLRPVYQMLIYSIAIIMASELPSLTTAPLYSNWCMNPIIWWDLIKRLWLSLELLQENLLQAPVQGGHCRKQRQIRELSRIPHNRSYSF